MKTNRNMYVSRVFMSKTIFISWIIIIFKLFIHNAQLYSVHPVFWSVALGMIILEVQFWMDIILLFLDLLC